MPKSDQLFKNQLVKYLSQIFDQLVKYLFEQLVLRRQVLHCVDATDLRASLEASPEAVSQLSPKVTSEAVSQFPFKVTSEAVSQLSRKSTFWPRCGTPPPLRSRLEKCVS